MSASEKVSILVDAATSSYLNTSYYGGPCLRVTGQLALGEEDKDLDKWHFTNFPSSFIKLIK